MPLTQNATKSRVLSCLGIFYALFSLVQIGSVKDPVFPESSFSPGDFQNVSLSDNTRSPVEDNPGNTVQGEQNIAPADNEHAGLFSCPVEGCVSTFQRHCNLERHMHYGKCKFVEERHSLLDKAKILYAEKQQEGSSAQPFIAGSELSEQSVQALPRGWALRSTKKAARFSAKQKAYLDEKFKIGEQTGLKADPAQVAQDMRHAKHEDGSRRFTVDEFLAPQQIKSYFSRMAAKFRQGSHDVADEWDGQAVAEQEAYSSARAHILEECRLTHPITYDTYNLCELYARNKLTKLSVPILRIICSHFEMEIDNLPLRLKKPYVQLIEQLVRSCSCA